MGNRIKFHRCFVARVCVLIVIEVNELSVFTYIKLSNCTWSCGGRLKIYSTLGTPIILCNCTHLLNGSAKSFIYRKQKTYRNISSRITRETDLWTFSVA